MLFEEVLDNIWGFFCTFVLNIIGKWKNLLNSLTQLM